MNPNRQELPGIDVGPLEVIVEDIEFRDDCMERLRARGEPRGFAFGLPLITSTSEGTVLLRVDFEIPDSPSKPDHIRYSTNRYVCWKGDDGITRIVVVFGWQGPPLSGE